MSPHCLDNWKQYLKEDDYNFLIHYVENIKHGRSNDNMIILSGPGRTGKSTLERDIQSYLGEENYGIYMLSGDIIYDKNIKNVGFLYEIDRISGSKKNNQAIINLIKYKQSFITDTNYIEKVNNNLLEYSKIITMEHVF